jgi:hypothetical protein
MAQNILDGFTFEGRFPGQGWLGPFNYKFRPALHARVTAYRETVRNAPAKVISAKQIEFLKEFLVSWDRVDENGSPLAIDSDMAYHTLSDSAVTHIWSDICGFGENIFKAEKN